MPTSYTSNLRLSNPGLGDTGWGSTVSNGMIDLVDPAIAGTTTLSADTDVILTTANGVADQARQMILNCTGSRAAQRTITAPASSKVYVVINGTTGGFGVKIVGVGPTTGVVVPAGRMAVVAWNGSDFVTLGAVVDLTASGNVTVAGTTTLAALTASGNVSFDGGTFVFNDSGADKDARFEGDTDANLLFLDASTDRVGIGTATPAAKLDVDGAVIVRGFLTPTDAIKLGANTSAPSTTDAFIYRPADNTLAFGTASSERMRLDSSGNLGIGITSPAGQLHLAGMNAQQIFRTDQSTSGYTYTQGLDDTGAYFLHNSSSRSFRWAPNSVTRMELDVSGNLFCQGVYNNTSGSAANVFVASNGLLQRSTSSLKYKTDVKDASHGLAEVMQLRPVTYKGKNDGDKVFGGLIAEEVHAAGLTEFVAYNDAGEPDALHYGNMVALLTKAIQEQQALITDLRARVAALEAK